MTTCSFLCHALRLAGIAVATIVLAASPALLPGVPLQASTSTHPLSFATDPGIIAYVNRSTHDIHLISPDGANDRILWTAPKPLSPYSAYDLAWRPDGRKLAFSSEHEFACSWYESDVYTIGYDGTGYRRVTNSPACAALAALPKGSVEVEVYNYVGPWVSVYVQGAPGLKYANTGRVRFDNVADFGPGVLQPAVGINGDQRTQANPPLADVVPGATVAGGILYIVEDPYATGFGTGKISWTADGTALAYGMRSSTCISRLPAVPAYGSTGEPLPVVEHAWPRLVAWGPTPAKQNQYLYYSRDDLIYSDVAGIYLNTVGNASGGTMLVPINAIYGETVYDIEWLPDGSGFLFSKLYTNLGIFNDIFEYNFQTGHITQVTHLPDSEGGARGISISPDGQSVVFEWVPEPWDPTSSLWIINRDGSNQRWLLDNAGRPAWGQRPPSPTPRAYLPMLLR